MKEQYRFVRSWGTGWTVECRRRRETEGSRSGGRRSCRKFPRWKILTMANVCWKLRRRSLRHSNSHKARAVLYGNVTGCNIMLEHIFGEPPVDRSCALQWLGYDAIYSRIQRLSVWQICRNKASLFVGVQNALGFLRNMNWTSLLHIKHQHVRFSSSHLKCLFQVAWNT